MVSPRGACYRRSDGTWRAASDTVSLRRLPVVMWSPTACCFLQGSCHDEAYGRHLVLSRRRRSLMDATLFSDVLFACYLPGCARPAFLALSGCHRGFCRRLAGNHSDHDGGDAAEGS